ncbi:hypothetical protein FHS11_003036 [Mucilaginibacter gotjawali]|uniref:Uncharacterized protein n=1 Tax=Mucilaginibacter gotjawali TaxID=1550579 RepID=A0A839SEE4_9SPHI|nr:hypothetical protein [Mucilaginibacter gotjawali]
MMLHSISLQVTATSATICEIDDGNLTPGSQY